MRYLGVGLGMLGAVGGVVASILNHNAAAATWAGIAAVWAILYGIAILHA